MPQKDEPQMSGQAPNEGIDIANMDNAKVAQLMKRDPKFINRLIADLDKSMHKMLSEREFRRRRIEDNLREIKKIDGEIAAHVRPNMSHLQKEVKVKKELQKRIREGLTNQGTKLINLERDAAGLVRKAAHSSKGIMVCLKD